MKESARDPALDGLRGVAILLVYLFHYGGGLRSPHAAVRAFGYLCESGWIGVHVFFVLSGYLITGLLVRDLRFPHALRNFYMRRALRIFPVYYGAIIAAAVAAAVAGAHAGALRPLLPYLAFLQDIPPLAGVAVDPPPPLPLYHLWSVAVEEQFYLLWPFLLLWAGIRRRGLALCLVVFGLTCAFRAIVFAPAAYPAAVGQQLGFFLLTRAGGLALGGALALWPAATASDRPPRWAKSAAIAGALCFLAVGWSGGTLLLTNSRMYLFAMPAIDIAAAATLALCLHPGLLRRSLSSTVLRWFGRISYGFYVLHILLEPLFDWIGRALAHSDTGMGYQAVRFLVALPITAGVAWASFRWFETPFLRLKRFFPREPSAST